VNLLRKRRGVSGIISGVFLVAVAVMIFNILAWQFFQADAYNRIFQERQHREWERFNERIIIAEVGYGRYLRFKVSNLGSVIAHIVTVYLNDTTVNNPRTLALENYICSNSSAWIGLGVERWIYTTIQLTLGNNYDLMITTERGNMAVAPRFQSSTTPPPGGQQGVPFTFGFQSSDFQYKSDWHDWQNAWEIQKFDSNEKDWQFKIKLTNMAGGSVQLQTGTVMDFVKVDGSTGVWQAVVTLPSLDYPTIESEKQTEIRFGTMNTWKFSPNSFYVFIAIFYKYTSDLSQLYGTGVTVLCIRSKS